MKHLFKQQLFTDFYGSVKESCYFTPEFKKTSLAPLQMAAMSLEGKKNANKTANPTDYYQI